MNLRGSKRHLNNLAAGLNEDLDAPRGESESEERPCVLDRALHRRRHVEGRDFGRDPGNSRSFTGRSRRVARGGGGGQREGQDGFVDVAVEVEPVDSACGCVGLVMEKVAAGLGWQLIGPPSRGSGRHPPGKLLVRVPSASTPNPSPSSLRPSPSILNLSPSALNPGPSTLHPRP